jgi:hypothetical protein
MESKNPTWLDSEAPVLWLLVDAYLALGRIGNSVLVSLSATLYPKQVGTKMVGQVAEYQPENEIICFSLWEAIDMRLKQAGKIRVGGSSPLLRSIFSNLNVFVEIRVDSYGLDRREKLSRAPNKPCRN